MADNYLEQRMDDLRMGRIDDELSRLARKKSEQSRPLYGKNVVIIGAEAGPADREVKAFRDQGAKVDIIGTDRAVGQALAQRRGARFIPVDNYDDTTLDTVFDAILDFRGHVDRIISLI